MNYRRIGQIGIGSIITAYVVNDLLNSSRRYEEVQKVCKDKQMYYINTRGTPVDNTDAYKKYYEKCVSENAPPNFLLRNGPLVCLGLAAIVFI